MQWTQGLLGRPNLHLHWPRLKTDADNISKLCYLWVQCLRHEPQILDYLCICKDVKHISATRRYPSTFQTTRLRFNSPCSYLDQLALLLISRHWYLLHSYVLTVLHKCIFSWTFSAPSSVVAKEHSTWASATASCVTQIQTVKWPL